MTARFAIGLLLAALIALAAPGAASAAIITVTTTDDHNVSNRGALAADREALDDRRPLDAAEPPGGQEREADRPCDGR